MKNTPKMLKKIDDFLNKTTMYRLTLYCVSFLWALAFIFSVFGILHYSPIYLIGCLIVSFVVCFLTNELFAKIYEAPTNRESVYITAFILASIVAPVLASKNIYFLILAGVIAMASKYILAIGKKHIFNPAAIGVGLASLLMINQAATWWMGTLYMAPFVLIAGILIARKIRRFDLLLSFFASSFIFIVGYGIYEKQTLLSAISGAIFDSPILYLGSIMLTEPMTTPPTKKLRIIYGSLVGFLNAPFIGFGSFYTTPEIALALGNIYSYLVSSKEKLVLRLKEKVKIANDTYDFIFSADKNLKFKPGQYLEWTLGHPSTLLRGGIKMDNRGMRRYFTIASSPTENEIIMGVKFYDKPSTYKQSLIGLKKDGIVVASQLAGDFTLPEDKSKKLVFIAGGIGITPFRSMIKYLTDKNEKRDIVIFYSNKTAGDIAYKDIFDEAEKKLGIKTIYHLTDEKGFLNHKIIEQYVPDFKERMFYISGPRSMILTFQKALKEAGIHKSHIKTDFFPGFA